MQPQQTPKGNENLIKIDKCVARDKTQYTIQYSMSDLAFQEFQGFTQKIFGIEIQQMEILEKQLDKPLSWFSKMGAGILGVKTKHEFLYFQTAKFLMTIDFYQNNRICVRVGDVSKVLQTKSSLQRKQAHVVKTQQGLEWKMRFKEGQLFLKDVFDCLKHKQLQKAHSKISFNGSHFSRKLWKDLSAIVQKRK